MATAVAPLRLVVTGREGQVVRSLIEAAPAAGIEVIALGRPDLDLAHPETIAAAIAAARPDVVVNAAAYTAVDQAEAEPEVAHLINATAAGAVAEAAAALGVPVIQISTDYVFDGTAGVPYGEEAAVGPTGVYGASKLAGEWAVAAANPDHVILRTAWVYAPFGKNFVRTMLRLGETRDEVRVVSDQHGCPTYAPDIAEAVIQVARNLKASPGDKTLRGVFHMAGAGETTWAGFAEAIFAFSGARGGRAVKVVPIPSHEYPTPARRPANSRLDCERLARVHHVRLPAWPEALQRCLARLAEPV